jgi:hypothetical protein
MNYKLQLDLDGVYADFAKGVFKLTGKFPEQLETRSLWAAIHRNKNFFLELDRTTEFDMLWDVCKRFEHVEFLTGAPSSKTFCEQKKMWVAKHFGPQYVTNVVPRRDKVLFAKPDQEGWKHILLDDTHRNIHEWEAVGGIGIHHDNTRPMDSVYKLEAFL